MCDKGSPPHAVQHHVQIYFDNDQHPQQSFEYFDYPFAFPSKTTIKGFKSSMVALSRHLKQ
jgi:hypothetical protein